MESRDAELESIKKEVKKAAVSGNPDDPNVQLLQIADKISKNFRANKAVQKMVGSPDSVSAFDKLFYTTDLEGFKKNVAMLAEKYDKQFTEISANIKKGAIDDSDYESFKRRLYQNYSEKIPQSKRGVVGAVNKPSGEAVQTSPDKGIEKRPEQRNETNLPDKASEVGGGKPEPTAPQVAGKPSGETNRPLGNGPVVEKKEVGVPREQLPVGSGEEKVSQLEARVKHALENISPEIIDQLGLSTYNQMNNKETIAEASQYVIKNPDEAMKVLLGEAQAPKGLPINSIYVAMVNNAVGNLDLANKLATLRATRMGQEIEILKEIDPNSPVKIVSDIYKVREEAFKKRYAGKSIKEVTDRIVEKAKVKMKAPDMMDWGKIIEEVRC